MRLSDIMSRMDLTVWPIAALVIFVGVFILVMGKLFSRSRSENDRAAAMPLSDDADIAGSGR